MNEPTDIQELLEYYDKQFEEDRPIYVLSGKISFYQNLINEIRISDKSAEDKQTVTDVLRVRITKMESELKKLKSGY